MKAAVAKPLRQQLHHPYVKQFFSGGTNSLRPSGTQRGAWHLCSRPGQHPNNLLVTRWATSCSRPTSNTASPSDRLPAGALFADIGNVVINEDPTGPAGS